MKVRFEKAGYTPLPSADYLLELISIVETQGKYGPVFKFQFKVLKGPYRGCLVDDLVNKMAIVRVKQKLWRRSSALLEEDLDPGTTIDLQKLIGKRCYGHIELKNSQRGIPSNAITDLYPRGDTHENP